MSQYDIVIRGGTVVTNTGRFAADVAISGETIAAVVAPGQQLDAARTIDATGKHVIPGAVDVHSHHREPGYTHKEVVTPPAAQACMIVMMSSLWV